MYWAFSGRTGPLPCFVWIHYCISVFPKLFNRWRVMRHDYPEFNKDTIGKSFSFFTTYYRKLHSVPCKWYAASHSSLWLAPHNSMDLTLPVVSNKARLNTDFSTFWNAMYKNQEASIWNHWSSIPSSQSWQRDFLHLVAYPKNIV